ncbi:MAG: hypothetical protein GF355_10240, partial [Candidatus Eisenbacteria bacterium]|nr:hypothetical protein [Candidatus Eisenbacteria bacterium]
MIPMLMRFDCTGKRHNRLFGFCALLCLLIPSASDAREMNIAEVRSAVETWVHEWTPDARPDAVVESLQPYLVGDEATAYIAHLSGGGFCLCGANSLVLPVYHYAPKGNYDPTNPGCQVILSQISERTAFLRRALAEGDPDILAQQERITARESDWTDLIRGRAPALQEGTHPRVDPAAIELPLDVDWGQGSPENDQCPSLSPYPYSEIVLTGCNGTAMAQMMYYWQWPSTGFGSHTSDHVYRYRPVGDWDAVYLETDPGIPDD